MGVDVVNGWWLSGGQSPGRLTPGFGHLASRS
jgi:hypothetical protein